MGDPSYLDDMATFEAEMLDHKYAAETRGRIDDTETQQVSAYNPDGFENSDSCVPFHPAVAGG